MKYFRKVFFVPRQVSYFKWSKNEQKGNSNRMTSVKIVKQNLTKVDKVFFLQVGIIQNLIDLNRQRNQPVFFCEPRSKIGKFYTKFSAQLGSVNSSLRKF